MTPHTALVILRVLALAATALLPAACGGVDAGAPVPQAVEAAAVAVATAAATERAMPIVVRATGTFVADESSDVTPQTSGSVIETPVGVGDLVKVGQMIVRLDERNAALDLNHAQAALEQAQAQAQNARVEAARHAELVESGDISRSAYEKLTTQLAVAQAGVAQAKARVASAEKAREDTKIKAPFGGHVSARPIAVGEYVTTSSKVATIVRIDPIKLALQVPEGQAAQLRPGMPVRAEVSAYPGAIFKGAVSARNVAIDPNSRAMTIEVSFRNQDSRLAPGMFGNAEVLLPATERAVYVPREAIRPFANGESSVVYVIDGDTARVRIVQPAQAEDGLVRIHTGVEAGALVATSNLDKLFDGAAVRRAPPLNGQ
jgi:membrane fusion protein (multidrug efflux system)